MHNKISVCFSGRFHFIDVIKNINVSKIDRLISDYPFYYLKKLNLSSEYQKHYKFLKCGFYGHFFRQTSKVFPFMSNKFLRKYTNIFSKSLHNFIIKNKLKSKIIVNSTFAKDIFEVYENEKILDHGSLHLNFEKKISEQLADKYDLKKIEDAVDDEIIYRENIEMNLADKIVVLSKLAKQSLQENGIDEKKILVIRPSISEQFFPIKTSPKKEKIFKVGIVGSMRLKKGLFRVIDLAEKLQIYKNIEFHFVGSFFLEEQTRKIFNEKIKNLKNCFFYGYKTTEDVNTFMNSCKIILNLSYCDGYGLVVNQSMQCGIPVICTNTTGSSEIISNNSNSFVINSMNDEKIIEQASEILIKNYEDDNYYNEIKSNLLKSNLKFNDYQLLNQI